MNPQTLAQIASQHQAEERQSASRQCSASRELPSRSLWARPPGAQSLRARTGWTLVNVGLRLAVPARQAAAATPRPARP